MVLLSRAFLDELFPNHPFRSLKFCMILLMQFFPAIYKLAIYAETRAFPNTLLKETFKNISHRPSLPIVDKCNFLGSKDNAKII